MKILTRTILWFLVLGSFVMACASATTGGSTTADQQSACDQAFAQATAIDPGSDTVDSVDGAIAGCGSLESWVSAAARHPDAFGGQDPATVAGERCAANPQLAGAAVCTDLQGS